VKLGFVEVHFLVVVDQSEEVEEYIQKSGPAPRPRLKVLRYMLQIH
jgi:hypothetical protein